MKSSYEIMTPDGKRARSLPRRYAGLARRRLGQALLAALVVVLGLTAFSSWRLRADTAYNAHNLIRLHVVANSDLPSDQEVKLEVRDAILEASGSLFSDQAPDEAVLAIKDNLPLFKRVAENVLAASGYDYRVEVEYGTFAFPERAYGPLLLPAGDYQALRVVLGDGQGANWWCILFPPLCYLDVVGGVREAEWGVTAGGLLAPAGKEATGTSASASAAGSRALPVDSLTPTQMRDLERVLQGALDRVDGERPSQTAGGAAGDSRDAQSTANVDGGVRVIISDVPSSPDSDLVILVADTGVSRTEVRFYVFDRLRELLRSLATTSPWLVESLPWSGRQAAGQER